MTIKFKRIGDLRIDNDLTQKQLAKILNTTRDCYAQWERGFCNFPIDKINKCANLYKVNVDYIVGLSNNKKYYYCKYIDLNIITTRVKRLRKSNHYSQESLCKIINMKQRTYSGYETGRSKPPLYFLYNLAKTYNVSLDYLLGRKQIKNIE